MVTLSTRMLTATIIGSAWPHAMAQTLSGGIVAGVSATSGFPNQTIVNSMPATVYTEYSSHAGDYLVGVMVEVRLPWNLSVEADGVYRPLNFKAVTSSVQPSNSFGNTVLSWDFPVLVKLRFPNAAFSPLRVTPLLEIGPSFRASGNRNDTAVSNHGATARVGVEIRARRLRLAPTLRYTRWASDNPASAFIPRSKQNQVEFLVGFSF